MLVYMLVLNNPNNIINISSNGFKYHFHTNRYLNSDTMLKTLYISLCVYMSF